MSLQYGFFHAISGYFSFPYRTDHIYEFLQFLNGHATINNLSFYNTKPSELTYDDLMYFPPEEKEVREMGFEDFNTSSFAHAEIAFNTGSFGRLNVNFWDAKSYSILLLLSQDDIDAGMIDTAFLNELTVVFFSILQPAFGHVGVEDAVGGFEAIKDGTEYLPIKSSYLCKRLYQKISALKIGGGQANNIPTRSLGNAGTLLVPEEHQDLNFYDLIRDFL